MLICEMVAYYKREGKTLIDVLESIYNKYGYYYCSQKNYTFEGESGMKKIASIMENLRTNPPKEILGLKVVKINDYSAAISKDIQNNTQTVIDLPKSNVLGFYSEDGTSFLARPSGTEPKIKFYLNSVAKTAEECKLKLTGLEELTKEFL